MSITTLVSTRDRAFFRTIRETARGIPGCRVSAVASASEVLRDVARLDVPLAICHVVNASDADAVFGLLRRLKAQSESLAVVVVADNECPEEALRFLRQGVVDYLSRPLDLRRLTFLLDSLTLRARYEYVLHAGAQSDPDLSVLPELAEQGDRPSAGPANTAMQQLLRQLDQVASSDVTLLLTGETGTGKTHLARRLHVKSSRREGPFVHVDCTTIPESLFESELFGHQKGAFTGADGPQVGRCQLAKGGTLFLDEIDALSLAAQAKLLRLVDEGVFESVGATTVGQLEARIVVASNRDLADEVRAQRFRQDLYFRLSVIEFAIPPLRERRDEIPRFVRSFLTRAAERHGRPALRISESVWDIFNAYPWPGNVRELRNVVERSVALGSGPVVEVVDLPRALQSFREQPPAGEVAARSTAAEGPSDWTEAHVAGLNGLSKLATARVRAEVARLIQALDDANNNRSQAARDLGVSREAFYKKLHKYGLIDYGH